MQEASVAGVRLGGRVAVVTEATVGMGEEIARPLANPLEGGGLAFWTGNPAEPLWDAWKRLRTSLPGWPYLVSEEAGHLIGMG